MFCSFDLCLSDEEPCLKYYLISFIVVFSDDLVNVWYFYHMDLSMWLREIWILHAKIIPTLIPFHWIMDCFLIYWDFFPPICRVMRLWQFWPVTQVMVRSVSDHLSRRSQSTRMSLQHLPLNFCDSMPSLEKSRFGK